MYITQSTRWLTDKARKKIRSKRPSLLFLFFFLILCLSSFVYWCKGSWLYSLFFFSLSSKRKAANHCCIEKSKKNETETKNSRGIFPSINMGPKKQTIISSSKALRWERIHNKPIERERPQFEFERRFLLRLAWFNVHGLDRTVQTVKKTSSVARASTPKAFHGSVILRRYHPGGRNL